jgi:hypothetical protein
VGLRGARGQRAGRRKKKGEGGRKEKKKKEKKRRKEKEEREEKEREWRSAGFVATIGSMRQLRWNVSHAERGEQRDETVIGAGVGMTDRREGFLEIRSSDGKGFRNVLSSTMKRKF